MYWLLSLLLKAWRGWKEREVMNVSALLWAYSRCPRAAYGFPQQKYHYMATIQGNFLFLPLPKGITVDFCCPLMPITVDKRNLNIWYSFGILSEGRSPCTITFSFSSFSLSASIRLDSAPLLPLTKLSNWLDVKKNMQVCSQAAPFSQSCRLYLPVTRGASVTPLPCVSTSDNPSICFLLSSQASNLNSLLLTSQKAHVVSNYSAGVLGNYFLNPYPSPWLHCAFSSTDVVFTLKCLIPSTMDLKYRLSLQTFLSFPISFRGTNILFH